MSVIDIEEWPAKVQSTLLLECLYIKLGALPCGSAGKESACNAGDLGLIPGLSSPITSWQIDGETMETETDFILGGSMAPHSSTLAWKIPWMEEPGGLQSMGSRRVGYD